MDQTVEQLQAALVQKIAALGKQRKEESERFAKEVAERNELDAIERSERIAKHKAQEEAHRQREIAAKAKKEEEAHQALLLQKNLEQQINAAEEARLKQEEKLRWLQDEISKAEFVEEQHKKKMQFKPTLVKEENQQQINVEHPVAPDNSGNAVEGTEGETPNSPLMSQHLKYILRQAVRSY